MMSNDSSSRRHLYYERGQSAMSIHKLFILSTVALALCASIGLSQETERVVGRQKLLDSTVREFVGAGATSDVVRAFARSMRVSPMESLKNRGGVIGFENASDVAGTKLTVNVMRSDVRTTFQGICLQNAGYRIVETEDPEIVNLIAGNDRTPGRDILSFVIPRLDIEVDMESEELITHLFDFSPEL